MRGSDNWVVAYVETDVRLGHGETMFQLYVPTLLSFGWKVILLAYDAQASMRWLSSAWPQYESNVWIIPIPPKAGGYSSSEYWQLIQSKIMEAETASGWAVDLAFLTWFDGLRPPRKQIRSCLGVLAYPWVGMYFTPGHLRFGTQMSWLQRLKCIVADYRLFSQPECRGLGILDEGVKTPLRWLLRGKPVVVFPEATDSLAAATKEIAEIRLKAGGRLIVGLLGHLAPRKGVLNFLRAATAFDEQEVFFLMAGELERAWFSPSEQTELEQLLQSLGPENGYFHLQRIAEASEFNAFFELCDVHCLVYNDFYHSSGLLAKAAISEKPVIVAQGHCMGERVEKFGLGLTVPANDPGRLQAAIKHLVKSGTKEKFRLAGGFAAYRASNAPHLLEDSLKRLCGPLAPLGSSSQLKT